MNCSVLRRRIRRSVDIHFSLLLCDRSGRRLLDHCRVTFFLLCRRISHSRFLLLASGQQRKAGEQTNVFFHTPYSYFSAKFGRLSGRNIPVAGDLRLGMSFAAALRASHNNYSRFAVRSLSGDGNSSANIQRVAPTSAWRSSIVTDDQLCCRKRNNYHYDQTAIQRELERSEG